MFVEMSTEGVEFGVSGTDRFMHGGQAGLDIGGERGRLPEFEIGSSVIVLIGFPLNKRGLEPFLCLPKKLIEVARLIHQGRSAIILLIETMFELAKVGIDAGEL